MSADEKYSVITRASRGRQPVAGATMYVMCPEGLFLNAVQQCRTHAVGSGQA